MYFISFINLWLQHFLKINNLQGGGHAFLYKIWKNLYLDLEKI